MSDFLIKKIISVFMGKMILKNRRILDAKRLIYLVFGSVFVCILAMSFLSLTEHIKAKTENRKPDSILKLLNITDSFTTKEIIVGMSSNIIFGFIDNATLFFGLSALKPYLPGGEYIQTGLANTFADVLALFLGTVISAGLEGYTGVNRQPIWAKIIGIVIGCLLGVFIPAVITGKV